MNGTRIAGSLAFAATLVFAGCTPGEKAPAAAPDRYELRGEIVSAPSLGSREITIKHEAIPGFKDDTGKVVGMDAMTMPFTLAEGVALDGLAAGDAVVFTLEVDWKSKRDPVRISKIAKDPAHVETLTFEDGAIPIPSPKPKE
jgi:Cu/Ag efflux protein CusF